jgi:hypothetical protein
MPRTDLDPLAGANRLVVDATNLLHALRRGSPPPAAALIGRIRAVVPATVAIVLVFDGAPEPGMRRTRIAAGVQVRYAAPLTADAAILELASRLDPTDLERLLVVSDDGELRHAVARMGARTTRSRWLIGRLERGRLAAPSTGTRQPVATTWPAGRPAAGSPDAADPDGGRWRPGRGATTKRGNPRRGHRTGG